MFTDLLTLRGVRIGVIALLALALLGAFTSGHAQTITFTPETVTGAGSVVPKLTWSTSPAATSCTASGDPDWTGTKAPSGTETLDAIQGTRTYSLLCTWAGDTTARLSWVAPTTNTDGSTLTKCASQTSTGACLRSFTIHHGDSAAALSQTVTVNDRNATSYTFTSLPPGPESFSVRAVNADGTPSDLSTVVSKTITASQSVTRNITITVNPKPSTATGLAVE